MYLYFRKSILTTFCGRWSCKKLLRKVFNWN